MMQDFNLNEMAVNEPLLTACIKAGKTKLNKTLFYFSLMPYQQTKVWTTEQRSDGKVNPFLSINCAEDGCVRSKGTHFAVSFRANTEEEALGTKHSCCVLFQESRSDHPYQCLYIILNKKHFFMQHEEEDTSGLEYLNSKKEEERKEFLMFLKECKQLCSRIIYYFIRLVSSLKQGDTSSP